MNARINPTTHENNWTVKGIVDCGEITIDVGIG